MFLKQRLRGEEEMFAEEMKNVSLKSSFNEALVPFWCLLNFMHLSSFICIFFCIFFLHFLLLVDSNFLCIPHFFFLEKIKI